MPFVLFAITALVLSQSMPAESEPAMDRETKAAYQADLNKCRRESGDYSAALKAWLAEAQAEYDEKFASINARMGKDERNAGASGRHDQSQAALKSVRSKLAAAKAVQGKAMQAGLALQKARDGMAEVAVHCKYGLLERASKAYRAGLTQLSQGFRPVADIPEVARTDYANLIAEAVAAHDRALAALVQRGDWPLLTGLMRDCNRQYEAVQRGLPDGKGYSREREVVTKAREQFPRSIGRAWAAAPEDPATAKLASQWIGPEDRKPKAEKRGPRTTN
jgi:hypothetical protein